MPYWWWVLPSLVAVLALTVVLRGLGALMRRRPYRALGGIGVGGLILAAAVAVLLIGLDTQTYYRMTYEQPIAAVVMHQTGDKRFDVTVDRPTGAHSAVVAQPATYPLQGDQWRIEALVLKWKSWANVLGLDTRYRLNRLAGEYSDTAAERDAQHSVYDLSSVPADDRLGHLARRLHGAHLVDTVYGSAALMPMADNARYEVWMTQSGLVARPTNDQAAQAISGLK